MNYRTFGKLGWTVSEIGIGTWAIGGDKWGPQDDNESRKTLHTAIDNGINFIDTAQVYGKGRSEKVIGEVLKERTEDIYVATKIPPKPGSPRPISEYADVNQYYPRTFIIEECEKSLRRLKRDYIDLLQFHTWTSSFNIADEWIDASLKLKKDGKIRSISVSVPDNRQDSVIGAIVDKKIDAVQVLYNIFEQSAQYNLFPVCEEFNIGIINRVPLFEGALTGKFSKYTRFHRNDFRRNIFGGKKMDILLKYIEQVESIKNKYCPDLSLAQYAIRFCLSHPAISTVIPGMRTPEQVLHNIQAINKGFCSEQELKYLYTFAIVRTTLRSERSFKTIIKQGVKRYLMGR